MPERHRGSAKPAVVIALAVVAVAAGVGAWAWLTPIGRAAPGGGAREVIPVRAAEAPAVAVTRAQRLEGYPVRQRFTGRIEAVRRSDLSFRRGERLVEVLAGEGDRVEAGQVLARLDTRVLDAERSRLAGELGAAEATLDELVRGPRDEDLAQARSRVAERAAELRLAEIRLRRFDDLLARRAATNDERDEAYHRRAAAAAAHAIAEHELDELENGTRPEQVAAQRGRVAALEAAIAQVEAQLEQSLLRAPFAGVVGRQRVDEGTVVEAGRAVFDLVEVDRLQAWVAVPPSVAAGVSPGDPANLTGRAGSVTGAIAAVMPAVDPQTRTIDVVIDLPANAGLRAGEVVRWSRERVVPESAVAMPTEALRRGPRGLWAVLTVDGDGRLASIDVDLVHAEGDVSYVRGAIADGAPVVISGLHRVVPGQRVEPVPGSVAALD